MKEKIIILFILLITSTIHATSYYMDATGGNDNNSGTSTALAWQTLDKIYNQTFLPGDSVLFKKGEIWRGRLIPPNSGNADKLLKVIIITLSILYFVGTMILTYLYIRQQVKYHVDSLKELL